MSRNKVNQTDGSLTMVAGRGKAEYGASTVRTGSFSNPALDAESGSTTQTITFAEPMPDSNYQVELDKGGNLSFVSVSSKTANGFTVTWARPYNSALPAGSTAVTYTAFKLYTDTEYNEVLEKVNNPDTAPTSGSTNLVTSGGVYNEIYNGSTPNITFTPISGVTVNYIHRLGRMVLFSMFVDTTVQTQISPALRIGQFSVSPQARTAVSTSIVANADVATNTSGEVFMNGGLDVYAESTPINGVVVSGMFLIAST